MVKIGHRLRRVAPATLIEPVPFANPRLPGLAVEVLPLAQLRERVPAHHRRVRSRPDFHQLMLIKNGSMDHDIDFIRYRCKGGNVLHLRPGQVQQFARDSTATGWALLFRPEFVPPRSLLETVLGPCGATLTTVAPSDYGRICSIMRALASAYEVADVGATSTQILQHLLTALLLQIARAREDTRARAQPQPAMLRVYRRFVQVLEQGFARTREASHFAKLAGCSVKTLSRACSALGGASPKRLIERRVALEAKRLLAHSPLAVSAIATELGFTEPTNFIKFFRRCEGVTPAVFRERDVSPQ
jgi:AraC-like DNA-binding protein